MQLNTPIDIADVLQAALNEGGRAACARPLPYDLASSLPLTLVETIGGSRRDVVLDRFAVRFYTWADTEADAIAESSFVMAWLLAHEGERMGGTTVYRVAPSAMPYPAHDTSHPDLSRACFTAYVYARASTIDITT